MNYLELVSTAITVLTAIPAIINWIKNSQSKLYLVIESEINLHQQIIKNIDGFEIFYGRQEIDVNARLLKGSLFYKGKDDLTSDRITSPIELRFPNEVLIRECKILSSSEALKVDTRIENNSIYFETKLIKNEEFFQFEVFYEALDKGKYKLLHRISNVEKKVDTLNYFNITWVHEANMHSAMTLMFLGFFAINEMSKLVDENKALSLDQYKFKYEYSLNGNAFDQDSIYSIFSKADYSYRNTSNRILNTFSSASDANKKLKIIEELNNNLDNFQKTVLKLSPFIFTTNKADSIINKRILENDSFYLFFLSSGPYKLSTNYRVIFKYRYSYILYAYAGGSVLYLLGAFLLFRYFRISTRHKFMIKQIEFQRKNDGKN